MAFASSDLDFNPSSSPLLPQVPVRFPEDAADHQQDEECCEVYLHGQWKRLRLHDYADIYRVPGLYESLFARHLQCTSPQRVVGLLAEVIREWPKPPPPTGLSVIDLGAGNGMVGEELRRLGVRRIVGVDIIPEAAEAADRDRPNLYDDYIVADLTQPDPDTLDRLRRFAPNCLTTVSALGFGDIPPEAFLHALSALSAPGWVAFNIKETFLEGRDESGFARLIRSLCDTQVLQVQAFRRYSHRLSVGGRRLYYVAMVARKLRDAPPTVAETHANGF